VFLKILHDASVSGSKSKPSKEPAEAGGKLSSHGGYCQRQNGREVKLTAHLQLQPNVQGIELNKAQE
jgi:hypothetical protein